MIVKMSKAFVVARRGDRDRLLEALRDLGVIHLQPVDPARAVADEETTGALERTRRAVQILDSIDPAGEVPEISPDDAVAEVIGIQGASAERKSRLVALHRQIEQLAIWGDARTEQFAQLRDAGIEPRFFSVPREDVALFEAEFVELLGDLPGRRSLVAVIDRAGNAQIPESADPIALPQRDRPSIRAEAAEIDASLKRDADRLGQLANLIPDIRARQSAFKQQTRWTIAANSALTDEDLFAIQGWLPVENTESLSSGLSAVGLHAAVQIHAPDEDDQPPTLIRYPGWAMPIKGLFDILGTVAGYKEFDVSAAFMIALPIFAAMLIGDGGYGVILLVGPLLFWKKASRMLGPQFTGLLVVIGALTLIWGLLNASFFGVLIYKPLIPVDMSDSSRDLIMRISFIMGAVHLSAAQVWRGVSLWPSLKSLAALGWAVFIWGMLGVVKYYVLGDPFELVTPWPYLLATGATLAILFDSPSRNPVKMLALGIANFPLSMLSAFSDVISYVRLMAVGLASGVLASSFNELAFSAGSWIIAVPVLVLGHGLNIGLALIALFAHGVRLNMLEFSNNLGMQWTGYEYEPFSKTSLEEIRT